MPDIPYLGPEDYDQESLVARLKAEQPTILSIDTETVSLKDRRIIGIGIGLNQREAVYFPVWPYRSKYLGLAWRLLATYSTKVLHNAMYDLTALSDYLELQVEDWSGGGLMGTLPNWLGGGQLADTSAMGQVQGLPSTQLAEMSHSYLGEDIDAISDILPERKTMLDLPLEVVADKCMRDCLATIRLYHKQGGPEWWEPDGHTWSYEPSYFGGWDPLEPDSYYVSPQMKDCYQVDMRLIPLLMRMSRRGIALRPDRVESWYRRVRKQVQVYEEICEKEGFEPSKNQQVGYVLASRGNFLPFTKSGKQLKTDNEVLENLNYPLAVVVLQYRKYSKLKGTYLEPWLDEERAYTNFRLDLSTARLSSFDRNMQNIPVPIRDVFEPDSGVWSMMDDNQIEMRVFAYVTQDPVMLKAYADGSDIHATTQMALWPGSDLNNEVIRTKAKTFNFAEIFYAIVKTLSRHTGLPEAVCARYDQVWKGTYPDAHIWMLSKEEEDTPWTENIYGRRCRLPDITRFSPKHIVNCRVNYPIQSSAAEIVKRQMLWCDRLNIDQALQVHDEILADGDYDFPEELAHIHPELHTPFKVKKGPNWVK